MTVPFRILSLLLCLLIAGPMSASAHAVARPETRVGNIFPTSPKSTAADLDQTAGTRWESRGCDYDFASGVCKYLYCHANPVNGVDPSGHFTQIELLVVTTALVTLSAITLEKSFPSSPSYLDNMNGGQGAFTEYDQTAWFEKRWPGWVKRAKEYFTEDIAAFVRENPGRTEIEFVRRPGRVHKIGVYPDAPNYAGDVNETNYGDKAESYWEKYGSLGAFAFEVDGPIRVDGSQWSVDIVVGDITGFPEDEYGYTITHILERHFIRARWHLTGNK